jgi:SAM-dependent methyltransferase
LQAEPGDAGYRIPPEVYDLAVGWDPRPEVERLLFLAAQAGVQPRSALELGCATGRLLRPLQDTMADVCGLELSAAMVSAGRARGTCEIRVGDMSDFSLGRHFDLIFTSANTIRHVLSDAAIARLWDCVAAHLTPGGVFIADLELGFADQAGKVGKPISWNTSQGAMELHTTWTVVEPPSPLTRCCEVEYVFEARGGAVAGTWIERFPLRTYDAGEFVDFATGTGMLELVGCYELRDPYLIETPVAKAVGRFLTVLRQHSNA